MDLLGCLLVPIGFVLYRLILRLFRRLGWIAPARPIVRSVFISYRRADSQNLPRALHKRLAAQFGKNNVFLDVDSIVLGTDFVRRLDRALARCSVLIVVIGCRWLQAEDDQGRRRLENPADYVRLEIEAALSRSTPVLLALIDGATAPAACDLPDSLKPLAACYSVSISSGSRRDVAKVRDAIKRLNAYSK